MQLSKPHYLVFFLAVFVAAYFHNPSSGHQNARLDAIYSALERPADQPPFSIDHFLYDAEKNKNTTDWSYYNGHYYSNKAPGTTILGWPVYWFLIEAEQLFAIDYKHPVIEYLNAYFLNFFLSVLPFGFAAACFYLFLIQQGSSQRLATWLSLALILTTPLWPYNTHLWGNTTATSFSIIALYLLKKNPIAAGFFLGWSVSLEYLVLLTALPFGIYALLKYRLRSFLLLLGGLIPFLLTIAYHYICFDSPWTLATEHVNLQYKDEELFMGRFSGVSLLAIWELLLGQFRGLFVASPLLALCIPGFIAWFRKKPDLLFVLSISICLIYLLVIAAFNRWDGGATATARYLIPAIPFAIFSLKYLQLNHPLLKVMLILLVVVSFSNMLVLASISPLVPDFHPNPLFGFSYQFF